jgi:Flp pilus assembly protein TadB
MLDIFNSCVDLLYWAAWVLGITYEEINVILFVFIHPAITILLFILLMRSNRKLKRLNQNLNLDK